MLIRVDPAEIDRITHVVPLPTLGRAQNLADYAQTSEPLLNVLDTWVLVRAGLSSTSHGHRRTTHWSSSDFFRYALLISPVVADGSTPI